MKIFVNYLFSNCEQIARKLRIRSRRGFTVKIPSSAALSLSEYVTQKSQKNLNRK